MAQDGAGFRKGTRVMPSGAGKTAAWPQTPGTVTRRLTRHSVEVVWDGTGCGDERELTEIRAFQPEERRDALPGFTPGEESERAARAQARRVTKQGIPLYRTEDGRLVTVPPRPTDEEMSQEC
jgi:hypothetical protein